VDVFCSTIIPTIGRATLSRAVLSVLDQDFDRAPFEVIVVNDSGTPLPDAEWQRRADVRVIETPRQERSVARNAGAKVARGRYLHFLDDDDVLLPGGLRALWGLGQAHPEAAWVYGAWETVDNDGRTVARFDAGLQGNIFADLVAGEGLPLQASLVLTDEFVRAGAFDPLVCGVEDRDLGRRVALRGSVACTSALVARVRIGRAGSTTDWNRLAEGDRVGREKALSRAGAFGRLWDSARSPFRSGRVSRAYAASAVWNLKRAQLTTAMARACAACVFARWLVVRPAFWRGLRTRIT
jgi:glycosyltransferase involved in cell wall biosynthesis